MVERYIPESRICVSECLETAAIMSVLSLFPGRQIQSWNLATRHPIVFLVPIQGLHMGLLSVSETHTQKKAQQKAIINSQLHSLTLPFSVNEPVKRFHR